MSAILIIIKILVSICLLTSRFRSWRKSEGVFWVTVLWFIRSYTSISFLCSQMMRQEWVSIAEPLAKVAARELENGLFHRYCFLSFSKTHIVHQISLIHKKWSFSVRISSVNVTKSANSARFWGFGHINWRDP